MTIALARAMILRRAVWRALDGGVSDMTLRQVVRAATQADCMLTPIEWHCYEAWVECELRGGTVEVVSG